MDVLRKCHMACDFVEQSHWSLPSLTFSITTSLLDCVQNRTCGIVQCNDFKRIDDIILIISDA